VCEPLSPSRSRESRAPRRGDRPQKIPPVIEPRPVPRQLIGAGGNFRALVRKATPPGQHIRLVRRFVRFQAREKPARCWGFVQSEPRPSSRL